MTSPGSDLPRRGPFLGMVGTVVLFVGCAEPAQAGIWPTSAAIAAASIAQAQPDDDDEEEKAKGPRLPAGKELGLALTFERGALKDTRTARMVALDVPAGTAPTPFLPPGPFRAVWEGDLTVPFRGEYTIQAAGRGKIKVELNGKAVLTGKGDDLQQAEGKPAKLKKGPNKLVVTYDSPPSGDAQVRLLWASEDFRREPINPGAFTRDTKVEPLAQGTRLREGRLVIAEMRCLNCHAPDQAIATADRMPELATDAPNLADAGTRLNSDWMASWIVDPKALRPTATMPKVIHGPQAQDQARDLAAYLATLGKPSADAPAPSTEQVTAGGRLFANLGCVGCHTLPDRDDWAKEPKRVPLRTVGAKWQPAALVGFLLNPSRHYAWIKMPNFHFTRAEAEQVAAYVSSPPAVDLGVATAAQGRPAADPERGRSLFGSAGCVSCHAIEPTGVAPAAGGAKVVALAAITDAGWQRGCVASGETPDRQAPDFALSAESADAVRALAHLGLDSLTRDAAPEFAERQVRAAQCNACHRRDGYDDVWTDHKVEVDKLLADAPTEEKDPDGLPYPADQTRPSLTWTGEKLRGDWAETFIAGRLDYKPRPYLRARMPAFATRAHGLAAGLAQSHGYPTLEPAELAADPELIPVAKQLVGNTGLNCVSCHNIGKVAAVGVFEAPGINFMHVKERLRFDYYDRWVRSPIRVEPETKMPTYFNNETSVLPTILEGKADLQTQALWNYIRQGRMIEPPGK